MGNNWCIIDNRLDLNGIDTHLFIHKCHLQSILLGKYMGKYLFIQALHGVSMGTKAPSNEGSFSKIKCE